MTDERRPASTIAKQALKSARKSLTRALRRPASGGRKSSSSDAADAALEALRAENRALEDARRESDAERRRLEDSLRRAVASPATPPPDDGLDESRECPICLERPKDTALVPCGHVLCGSCVGLANAEKIVDECPVCRETVRETMRVYL